MSGSGDTCVVFLHGWGGDFNNFSATANALPNCICVNFSFFDREPLQPLFVDDYVNFVCDSLSEIKAKKYIVVGHSFGGRIIAKLNLKIKFDSVVLIDVAGLKPRKSFKYFKRKAIYKIKKMLKINTQNCGSPDYIALSPIMKRTFNNIVLENLHDYYKKINIPTLIIWGNKDKDTPLYMAKSLNKLIPNSGLIIFKNCGHYSYLDKFDEFVSVLKYWIKQ